jgi:hypothetical protein
VGFAVFKKKPTSLEIRSFLGRVIVKAGKAPKHLITDKDKVFDCKAYRNWCKRRKISYRYGDVGKHGSIAIIERFIKTMKDECTREILVPLRLSTMRRELVFYSAWYNEHRPHLSLDGMTPHEVYDSLVPANSKPRYEPRPHWPRGSPCAGPQAKVKGRRGCRLVLQISLNGRASAFACGRVEAGGLIPAAPGFRPQGLRSIETVKIVGTAFIRINFHGLRLPELLCNRRNQER